MEIKMNTYAERLTFAIEKKMNGNKSHLAKKIGVKVQAIQYLCRKGVKSNYTNAIANALGINANWLDKGVGEMELTNISDPQLSHSFNTLNDENEIINNTHSNVKKLSIYVDIPILSLPQVCKYIDDTLFEELEMTICPVEGGKDADDPLAVRGVYGTGGARAF